MPPKKRKAPKEKVAKKNPSKSSRARDPNPHLPGYLLIAFGLMGVSLNFDLLLGLEWAKAYPLLLVLFGIAVITKAYISRD